jgi:hypothetical protein
LRVCCFGVAAVIKDFSLSQISITVSRSLNKKKVRFLQFDSATCYRSIDW